MSEKKGLKQSRLPFQIISTSPKVITDHKPSLSERSSPKIQAVSRKRKQSNDGDNVRSSKIGRTNSKENIIAEQDTAEIVNISDDSNDPENIIANHSVIGEQVETTSTSALNKSSEVRKIKIGKSCTKRKQAIKPMDPEDSVVYLSEEELQSIQKSSKQTEKKKSKNQNSIKSKKRAKKLFSLDDDNLTTKDKNDENMEVDVGDLVLVDEGDKNASAVNLEKDIEKIEGFEEINNQIKQNLQSQMKEVKMVLKKAIVLTETDDDDVEVLLKSELQPEIAEANQTISEEISKLVDKSIENGESSSKELQDDIVDILTDEEKKSPNQSIVSLTKTTPKLTPKALARRKELESKRIEKELQKQKEREEKEKQRLKEKEMREEAKRKEREEKEEARRREKDEKEKKRLAELEKKEEEKRQKEEERKRIAEQKEEEKRQKEEEKRQKEEEKRQKEEEKKRIKETLEEEKKRKEIEKIKEEERKKKAAEAFSKFFVPSKKKNEPQIIDDEASKDSAESSETIKGFFMPFQIHGKMRLAPRIRTEFSAKQKEFLDEILYSSDNKKSPNELYLKQLKCSGYIPKFTTKTWPVEEEEKDDVILVDELEGVGEDIKEDDAHFKMQYRAKMLLFRENRRPAYYGTWRKKSKTISARRPFAQDIKFFDYEVDSDEEWEEEEPGESLHGSDSEKEQEKNDDDYEVDDDFLVPHGHLSEDEMQHDDEIMEDNSPETQKAKLKVLQQEFAAEMKKKTEKIKPRLIGCIWMNGDEDEDGGSMIGNLEKKYHCSDIIWRILKAREMMSNGVPIKMEEFEPEIIESEEDNNDERVTKQQKTPAAIKLRQKIEGESVKELIRLLHGNTNSKKFLIKEFQAYRLKNYHKQPDFQEFLFKSIDEKITEISVYKTCPIEGPLFGKKCWYVKEEIVKEFFGTEEISIPNQWTYILEKEKKIKANNINSTGVDSKKINREVSPNSQPTKGNKNPQVALKIIEEAPKASNPFKITSLIKNSPKSSTDVRIDEKNKSLTPLKTSDIKTSTDTKLKIPTPAKPSQSKVTTNETLSTSTDNTGSKNKKRVALLMSVKPGQAIDIKQKNLLVDNFIKTNQNKEPINVSNVDKIEDVIEIID